MRGVLALLVCLAVLAAPAQAQKLPAKPPASKSATAALLRGPLDPPANPAPSEKAPAPAAATPLPAILAPLASAKPPPDADRCKLTCASDYYFCGANSGSDECPAAWSQCRAACVAPSLARDPPASPAT